MDIILTIIIPYYRTYEYTEKLLNKLIPQLNDKVEVIVLDDGCNETRLDEYIRDNLKVIHLDKNSGTASIPRNKGLDNARGKFIAFIDADDMVSDDYVEEILKKCEEDWDYFYIGWESKWGKYIIEEEPLYWNTSCWNCVYNRKLIGENRFEPIRVGEDKEFVERVRKGTHSYIDKILYYYDTDVEGSITWNLK